MTPRHGSWRACYLVAAASLGLIGTALADTKPGQAPTPAARPHRAPTPGIIDLSIDSLPLRFSADGPSGTAIAVNGSVPGPIVHLREGEDAVIRVTNHLREATSIHWHGLLVPPEMDGVPGVSFAGIQPGEVFTYRLPVRQSGTYWAHSHSGGQELLGLYFPLVVDPAGPEPFKYDRDYVVMLSEWSFDSPEQIMSKLKSSSGYYNYQRRTAGDFFSDIGRDGLVATLKERLGWATARMDPTDFADVTGSTYTYLMNGLPAAANWTGLFRPHERVRLRFIGAGGMTFFDVRIPGLKMSLVQADGQNVRPVEIDEFRIGPGETYDVIVEPAERAFTVYAETLDRSGYVRGTLAPREGMVAEVPPRRSRPLRTMADMGMAMAGMAGMDMKAPDAGAANSDMAGMDMKAPDAGAANSDMAGMDMEVPDAGAANSDMAGMDMKAPDAGAATDNMAGMDMEVPDAGAVAKRSPQKGLLGPALPGAPPVPHGPDTHGAGNSMVAMASKSRLDEPGAGLEQSGRKVLVYTDLASAEPQPDQRQPEREIELHLTGNMDRYLWSFDGKKYSEASTPIPFHYGERLRMTFVNDTMMEHPIHLHGMWMELENGRGKTQPRKHTIVVKPAERVSVVIGVDAPGRWAMHCHLLLHMEMGMFRVVEVSAKPSSGAAP